MHNENTPNEPQPFGLWSAGLLFAAGGLRLITPWYNFAPLGGLSLFGGGRVRSWQAFAFPLLVMLSTDVALSYLHPSYPAFGWWTLFNGIAYLGYVVLGRLFCRTNSVLWIGGASLLGSVQFFLITNFQCWILPHNGTYDYPLTLDGLCQCYAMGLPFFPRTLASDLVFSAILFGAFALVTRLSAAPKARLAS